MEFVIPARGGGIGRGHWNAIQLTDSQVSRSHCAVELIDNQQVLVDVGSFSGTRVNGQPVSRHVLEQGDVISLGNTRLAYMPPDINGDWSNERTDMHAPIGAELLGGRYEIMGMVGAGGMGSVYRVRDRVLDEIVALKTLKHELSSSPSMRSHFRREVKLARRVTHRNVARIFDIGEHHGQRFLTMEFIDGEPLSAMLARRGALPLRDVLDIALELCEGLAAAHTAGVIHRDLKPENVLIAFDGRVVITDFGIALDPDFSEGATSAMMGTPTYMAPEMLGPGASSGPHTDIYSLGGVLYEMVAGEPPWTGASQVEIATARLYEPPPDPRAVRPDLPDALAAIIVRCMATSPDDRFAEVTGVATALGRVERSLSAGIDSGEWAPVSAALPGPKNLAKLRAGTKTEKRVAVIPFENQGGPEDSYLADGLTSELLDTLALTPGLLVTPFARVAQCSASRDDLAAVGRELQVQVILTGSVVPRPDAIEVNARLVNVADGFRLWAETFEFTTSNLLIISDRAVRSMVDALALSAQPMTERNAVDAKAVELYLRGRSEYSKFGRESLTRALEYFEGARELADDDATILAACAMAHARLLFFRGGPNDAATLARRAMTLAPHQAESHLALAMARFYVNDLEVALKEATLATALSPTLAEAHLLIGRILLECGPLDEAEKTLAHATMLDPQIYMAQRDLAHVRMLLGHNPTVVRDFMKDMPSRPDAIALRSVALIRMALWHRDREIGREALTLLEHTADSHYQRALVLCRAVAELLANPDREWPRPAFLDARQSGSVRRKLFFWQIEAEVAAFLDQPARFIDRLTHADDAGLTDINWLRHCPLMQPFRQPTPDSSGQSRSGDRHRAEFERIRTRVAARAGQVMTAWRRL